MRILLACCALTAVLGVACGDARSECVGGTLSHADGAVGAATPEEALAGRIAAGDDLAEDISAYDVDEGDEEVTYRFDGSGLTAVVGVIRVDRGWLSNETTICRT